VIRAVEALGLTDVSHHTMRHTGVTLMLEHGINPRVIQFLAGWTSLRMLDRYRHVRDTEIRRAVTGNAEHVEQARKTGPQTWPQRPKPPRLNPTRRSAVKCGVSGRYSLASPAGFEPEVLALKG